MKTKPKKQLPKIEDDNIALLPIGMQKTYEVSASKIPKKEPTNTFSAMETGQPDTDRVADIRNPQGVQSGRGPTNQEGEGDRQNSELAELEQIEPRILDEIEEPEEKED